MFSPSPFPDWAPQLLTGKPEVDNEHRLLLNAIARLKTVCQEYEDKTGCDDCSDAQVAACNDELIDAMGDVLAALVDHFYIEEKAMREFGLIASERELCDLHKEDHAAISDTVVRLIQSLGTRESLGLICELHEILDSWLKRHIELHDKVLVRMLQG